MHEDEVKLLEQIKGRFGGNITRAGTLNGKRIKAACWSSKRREVLTAIVLAVNGHIQLSKRYKQFCLVCRKLGVTPKQEMLERNSSWLAGFFDAEGYLYLGKKDQRTRLAIEQKDKALLDQVASL